LRLIASAPDVDLGPVLTRYRISTTRLRHLVSEQTGTPLRVHRLWHRTMVAVEAILGGASIGAAAAAAGFADHAHFTRAFARFVGRTPSSIHGRTTVLDSYVERAAEEELSALGIPARSSRGGHACGRLRA
jgi:AraC-like DNA-binding protein